MPDVVVLQLSIQRGLSSRPVNKRQATWTIGLDENGDNYGWFPYIDALPYTLLI
jgi:hypothetical protein